MILWRRGQHAGAAAPLALVAGLALGGCAYNLDCLRNRCDGGHAGDAEAGLDADADATVPDDVADDAQTAVCTSRPVIDPQPPLGVRFGRSLVVTGQTLGAPSTLTPGGGNGGCIAPGDAQRPASEQVFRYVVERGPNLYATTDAPTCAGVFDSIVYIRTSCEQDVGQTLACNDDDNVLGACDCSAAPDNCPGRASSTLVEGLSPGQVVFVVVDGFDGRAGPFRLTLTEGAVRNAPLLSPASTTPRADRCGCPGSLDTETLDVAFPSAGDAVVGSSTTTLAQPGDTLQGVRRLAFSRIAGTALTFRLARNGLAEAPGCADAEAVLDLLVNGVAVHAFTVTAQTPVAQPVSAAFQLFAPVAVPTTADVPVSLRLRRVTRADCGGLVFALEPAGALTLLGRR